MTFGKTIAQRLAWGFGVVLGLLGLLVLVTLISAFTVRSANQSMKSVVDSTTNMEKIRGLMLQNQNHLTNYLLSGDAREVEKLNTGLNDVASETQKDAEATESADWRDTFQHAGDTEREWNQKFAQPLIDKRKQVDAGNATVAELQIFYLQQDPASWITKMNQDVDDAVKKGGDQLVAQKSKVETATTLTLVLVVIFAIVALVAGLWIGRLTAHSITEPLFKLMVVTKDISESGDLDQKIEIEREDEIGELAKSFNHLIGYLKEMAAVSEAIAGGDLTVAIEPRSKRDTLMHAFARMTEGLRSMVKSVRDNASQVASGSNQVADASEESAKISVQASSAIDEVTSTMHEMSVNVQNMVKNTQTQASSVSETSASIDQMVASIQRVADTSKVLLDISHRSREEVQNGITTMDKTTDGLSRINTAIQSSGEIISALGQRADDIGKIIEVIDDLAEQTNLLALNAAIEAARAGEHGLGFAVVADEVRKLAEKSASSTKEISELISSIQKEARKAVENMERSTGIVNEGLTLGTDLQSALKKISNVVTEVYKFAQEIGAATSEQSHGSTQIAKATTRLNEITHEINSSVEEQASGAQAVVRAMEKMRELISQTTSGSTELAASAEQMSKMSRALLEAMDRFVLESGHNGAGQQPWSRREEQASSRFAAASRS
jgi:methyl-accepting chemotaxis protein